MFFWNFICRLVFCGQLSFWTVLLWTVFSVSVVLYELCSLWTIFFLDLVLYELCSLSTIFFLNCSLLTVFFVDKWKHVLPKISREYLSQCGPSVRSLKLITWLHRCWSKIKRQVVWKYGLIKSLTIFHSYIIKYILELRKCCQDMSESS